MISDIFNSDLTFKLNIASLYVYIVRFLIGVNFNFRLTLGN